MEVVTSNINRTEQNTVSEENESILPRQKLQHDEDMSGQTSPVNEHRLSEYEADSVIGKIQPII